MYVCFFSFVDNPKETNDLNGAMCLTYSEYKFHPVDGAVTKASVSMNKRYFPTISTQVIILHQCDKQK